MIENDNKIHDVSTKSATIKQIYTFDKHLSPKGGYGLFANEDMPAHTVVTKLTHNRNDGVVIEQKIMCWGCWEEGHGEMQTNAHSFVLREVLQAVLTLIRPGSCAALVEITQSALKANIVNISDITSELLCNVVRKLCRTFCCKGCDSKFEPSECYRLRNAWTLFSASICGFQKIFKTMDRILAIDGDNVKWGLDPVNKWTDVRLINEPNQEEEANAVFVDRLRSKQKREGVKRHEVVVVSTKQIHAGEEICAAYGDGVAHDYGAAVDERDVLMCDNFYVIIEPNGSYDIHEVTNGSCINEQTQNTAKRRLVKYAKASVN